MSGVSDDNEPRRPEPTSTVLARIEGSLKLIDFKFDDLRTRMSTAEGRLDKHDEAFESVRLTMQQVAAEAKARAAADAAASAAVKEARSLEREIDERRWTPRARLWTTVATLASVILAVFTVLAYTHH